MTRTPFQSLIFNMPFVRLHALENCPQELPGTNKLNWPNRSLTCGLINLRWFDQASSVGQWFDDDDDDDDDDVLQCFGWGDAMRKNITIHVWVVFLQLRT